MKVDIAGKLEEIERSFVRIEEEMGKPEVISSPEELQRLAKRHAELEPIVSAYRRYKGILSRMEEDRRTIETEDDPELLQLAKEELKELEREEETLLRELKIMLLPRDPNDEKNVIVEIRAGAGGEEAALFAADLYRMYSRFAEKRGWKVELLSSNETGIGGFKEIVFAVRGRGAYSLLKYESGVHRVQRVPVTEASGRIHTSTATVAVLPEADEIDVQINPDDLKVETFRASGAGGQYVNMTDSAVRITHVPTGIVVSCQDERSQYKNRVKAMSILRAKLYELERQKQESAIRDQRRSQIGTGERSEKIRTYNFPQNRVTDHRVNFTVHKLEAVLDGDLDEIIEQLVLADQAEKLKQLEVAV